MEELHASIADMSACLTCEPDSLPSGKGGEVDLTAAGACLSHRSHQDGGPKEELVIHAICLSLHQRVHLDMVDYQVGVLRQIACGLQVSKGKAWSGMLYDSPG